MSKYHIVKFRIGWDYIPCELFQNEKELFDHIKEHYRFYGPWTYEGTIDIPDESDDEDNE